MEPDRSEPGAQLFLNGLPLTSKQSAESLCPFIWAQSLARIISGTNMEIRMLATLVIAPLGWVMLCLALKNALPQAEFALVFSCVAYGECAALLLSEPKAGLQRPFQRNLEILLAGWVCLVFAMLLFLGLEWLPFFAGQPLMVICLLALAVCIGMLRLIDRHHRPFQSIRPSLVTFRLWFCGGIVFMSTQVIDPRIDIELGLVLLAMVLLLCVKLCGHPHRHPIGQTALGSAGPAMLLLKYPDVLLLPFLFMAENCLVYLFARGISILPQIILGFLETAAQPNLSADFHKAGAQVFSASAARINLGFLLVGGASILAVMTAAPWFSSFLELTETDLPALLSWLLMGQAASVVFGATGLLLCTLGHRPVTLVVHLIGVIGFMGILLAQPVLGLQDVAAAYVVSQWGVAGVNALLLVRYAGVWPGITALLFRQIRLF
ncbi:MAG: hypothetical protein ACJAVM_001044 [Sulfitobacter sp.]|jgi:hypothetical protein